MSSGLYPRQSSENAARINAQVKSNYITVARGNDLIVIRVIGRGNMLNAPALQEFAEKQLAEGFSQFLFDLERCIGLDSTFMGVMVGMRQACESGFGIPVLDLSSRPADESGDLIPMTPEEAMAMLSGSMAQPAAPPPKPQTTRAIVGNVSAVNVSKELLKLLQMLGVDNFIKVRGTYDLNKLESTMLPDKAMTPAERSALIYQAHTTLVEIDKRNQAQFGDLLKSLEREMGQ